MTPEELRTASDVLAKAAGAVVQDLGDGMLPEVGEEAGVSRCVP